MKKSIRITLLFLIFLTTSCNQVKKDDNPNKMIESDSTKKEYSKNLSLSNQLYLLAPEFDSKNCESYGECDCCSSNYLFLDNENFISVDYCLETNTFYSGKYKVQNDSLKFNYNPTIVLKEYNWESETDTINTLPRYLYKIEKCKSFQSVWIKLNCNEKSCFKKIGDKTEFASIDNIKSSENILNELKKEGLIEKLNLK